MSRGDYRMDAITTPSGALAAVPSEEWKKEVMTPILHRVKGPLSRKTWRYVRYEHLESALRRKKLYFPRADQLGDEFEGSFSDRADFRSQDAFKNLDDDTIKQLNASHQKMRREMMQRLFFVSCWHMNTTETELLWERYAGKHVEAVAISTMIASLCTLRPSPIKMIDLEFTPRFWAGEIDYIDHSVSGSVPDDQLSLFYKKREFSGDREFRAIVQLWNMGWSQHERPDLPLGIEVDIAPAALFDKIVVKPKTPGLKDKVNRLLDEVGYDIPVVASELDNEAIW